MAKTQSRKRFRAILAKLLVCSLVLPMLVVGLPGVSASAASKPAISKKSASILVGKEVDLNVKNQIKDSTYVWKSSDKTIATVDKNGIVKGLKKGTVTIKCKLITSSNVYQLSSKITVVSPATSLKISNKIKVLNVGQSYDFNCKIKPSSSNDKASWTKSNSGIISLKQNGKVVALKEGTVTIKGKSLSGKTDSITIKVVDKNGTVTTQKQLEQLLGSGAAYITLKTDEASAFTILSGDYSNQTFTVDAPNADVTNKGIFKSVSIKQIKKNTWYEQAIGNVLNVTAPNSRIVIDQNASASISVNSTNTNLTLVNNGTVRELEINANAAISITGTTTTPIPTVANFQGATITTSVPLAFTATAQINLVILPGAETTTVTVANESLIPNVTGSGSIQVVIGTGANAETRTIVAAPVTPAPGGTTTPTTPSTPPTPPVSAVSGKVVIVATGSAFAVSGSAIVATGSAVTVTGSAVTVRILKYEGTDISSAIASIFTNSNTIVTTTDSNGIYSTTNLETGNYVVVMSKEGYQVFIQLISVIQGATTIANGILIENTSEGITDGYVSGEINDSLTGNQVDANLQFNLEVYNNFNSISEADKVSAQVVSGAAFTLSLPDGYYTLKLTDMRDSVIGTTYATSTINVIVIGGCIFTDQDFVLATLKDQGQATFVLTWGEYPMDLDSHLIGPVASGDLDYHIYYMNDQYPTNVDHDNTAALDLRLDLDDTTSYGPETTSIYNPVSGGEYIYYVYNYSGNSEGTLVNSEAKVVVTTSTGTYIFDVPAGAEQRSWVVCSYDSATGVVTPINQLVDGDYYDVYGNDPA